MLFCRKISFVAIYAVLVSNFWAENGAGVKNKWQIWGMTVTYVQTALYRFDLIDWLCLSLAGQYCCGFSSIVKFGKKIFYSMLNWIFSTSDQGTKIILTDWSHHCSYSTLYQGTKIYSISRNKTDWSHHCSQLFCWHSAITILGKYEKAKVKNKTMQLLNSSFYP